MRNVRMGYTYVLYRALVVSCYALLCYFSQVLAFVGRYLALIGNVTILRISPPPNASMQKGRGGGMLSRDSMVVHIVDTLL